MQNVVKMCGVAGLFALLEEKLLGATSKCHTIPLCEVGAVHLELNIIDQQAQGAKLAFFLLIGNKSLKTLQNQLF